MSLWFCDRRFGRADARQAGITTGRIWPPGSIHRPLSSDQGKAARTGCDAKLRFESWRVMAASVMRYGGKMPLEDSGSAGWQGVSGIGLLEGDCFATLIHDRLFPVHFSPADWESRVESWMPNEAWKATTRISRRFSVWDVVQSEYQAADKILFNKKNLIASKVR